MTKAGVPSPPGGAMRRAWSAVWGDGMVSIEPTKPLHAVVDQWWTEQLAALPTPNSILEIGAGAAAQPSRVAARLFPEAMIVAADLRPLPRGDGLHTVSGAAIENLPFAAAAFDLILSQFAFEYAQREPAIDELLRVLRPKGAARLLMHNPDTLYGRYLAARVECLALGSKLADILDARGASRSTARLKLRQTLRRIEALAAWNTAGPKYQRLGADLVEFLRIGALAARGVSSPDPTSDEIFMRSCAPALLIARAQVAATSTAVEMDLLMRAFEMRGACDASYTILRDKGGEAAGWGVLLELS